MLKHDLEMICKSTLFNGISISDVEKLLQCLLKDCLVYEKGEIVLMSGQPSKGPGIVCLGELEATKESYDGKLDVITHFTPGGLFGEILVATDKLVTSPVTITSKEHTRVIYMDYNKLICGCGSVCGCHNVLRANLLKEISIKYWELNRKLSYITIHTIRRKLCLYLSDCITFYQSKSFQIPFNRTELAGYLNTDRAALSRELSKMQKENIIQFKKNSFLILNFKKLTSFL